MRQCVTVVVWWLSLCLCLISRIHVVDINERGDHRIWAICAECAWKGEDKLELPIIFVVNAILICFLITAHLSARSGEPNQCLRQFQVHHLRHSRSVVVSLFMISYVDVLTGDLGRGVM